MSTKGAGSNGAGNLHFTLSCFVLTPTELKQTDIEQKDVTLLK